MLSLSLLVCLFVCLVGLAPGTTRFVVLKALNKLPHNDMAERNLKISPKANSDRRIENAIYRGTSFPLPKTAYSKAKIHDIFCT